ncbi:tRNA lysidine(34) synthetase TilS [Kaistella palustris]|uniref:tRNA lysidine(34) synthetase TilS n=1 Tax=Kaistella palustris TaxID=493376 RepID=UPI0004140AB8|nr:tRNA lysidine(34) synthetase TilS [Kaistella palustris]
MLNSAEFQRVLESICADFKTSRFLLAVSGGVDSMVLLHFFNELGLDIQVAHINYGLRGKDSDADEELVKKYCKKYRFPFHLYTVSPDDARPDNSIQMWARELRYNFFRSIKAKENIGFVVTAHHLNDELETFIINLSKAAGIKGLSGIPENENAVLRPLLKFSKAEIYGFAESNGIDFREDLSNKKDTYLRNRIRNTVVPDLLKVNQNFLENFGKSITYLKETKNYVQEKIAETECRILYQEGELTFLRRKEFFAESDFAQLEILRKFGFNDKTQIQKIQTAETGKSFFSPEYRLLVDSDTLVLHKIGHQDLPVENIEMILKNTGSKIILPSDERDGLQTFGNINWKLDAALLHFPLKITTPNQSDFFYPIGMTGKKKVAKFFKDEKIPILARQKTWILRDSKDHVLGILPFRQDRRFAAKPDTVEVISLETRPANNKPN